MNDELTSRSIREYSETSTSDLQAHHSNASGGSGRAPKECIRQSIFPVKKSKTYGAQTHLRPYSVCTEMVAHRSETFGNLAAGFGRCCRKGISGGSAPMTSRGPDPDCASGPASGFGPNLSAASTPRSIPHPDQLPRSHPSGHDRPLSLWPDIEPDPVFVRTLSTCALLPTTPRHHGCSPDVWPERTPRDEEL